MPSFKFDSQSFFLTYAQSGDLTEDQIITHLQSIKDILWLRIAKENHQDGHPHYHVVGKFNTRLQTRDARIFDVGGKHPNIQSVRSITKCIQYVSKGGEFRDIGTVPGAAEEEQNWVTVATECNEAEYYTRALRSKIPFMYAKKFWDISRTTGYSTTITDAYEAVLSRECFELLVHIPSPDKSTVVIGPSGCGKTSWAKRVCAKPALWVRHLDVLRAFDPHTHKSIIFDDMSFKHLPREAQIYLTDTADEAHIHIRYGHAIIPAGVQRIFTCNYYPFIDDIAIPRRIYKIEVEGTIIQ